MKKKNEKVITQAPSQTMLTCWNVDNIIFAILMATMLISPYFRGLFFAENYLVFNLICTALFMVLLVRRWFAGITRGVDSLMLPSRPIDYLFWLLPLAYLISMIGAVEPGLARNEFLRNFNYAVIAMVIIMTVKTRLQQQIAVLTFFITTVWVALFGYGVMFSIWEFQDGMTGTRLSSVFQYPNTLAAFVGAGCLLGLFLILYYMVISTNQVFLVKKLIKKWCTWITPLILIAVAVLFSVMLHTGSRGGWLVFVVMYAISLLVTPLRQKLFYILLSSISMVTGVYLYTLTNRLGTGIRAYEAAIKKSADDPTVPLDPSLVVDYAPYVVKFVLVVIVLYGISFVCNVFYQWISQDQKKYRQGQLVLGAVIIIIVIAGISLVPQLLPKSTNLDTLSKVWERFQTLQNIDSTSTDSLRFTFNSDAMKIVQDYPMFGAGGGAWRELFQRYQDHPYWSTQAHTYYMQLATETGTFGLISLVVLLCGVVVVFFIAIRKTISTGKTDEANKLQLWGIAIALLMLLAHSAVDFNMAYSIYGSYAWLLLALIITYVSVKLTHQAHQVEQTAEQTIDLDGSTRYRNKLLSPVSNHAAFHRIQAVVIALVTVIIFFVNVQPLNAINNYQKSAQLNQKEQTAQSFDAIRTAYRADSKNVDILIYYTNFLNEIVVSETNENVKQQYLQELFAVLTKASEQFPYNTRIKNQLIDMYFTHGYSVDAVNELNRLIEIAPYTPSYYDRNIEYSYRLGLLYLEQSDQYADQQMLERQESKQGQQALQTEQQARQYWQQAVDAYEQYTRLYKQIVEQQKPNEYQFRILKVTNLYAALAYYSLGQTENADEILQTKMQDNPAWQELSASMQGAVLTNTVTNEAIQAWLGRLP